MRFQCTFCTTIIHHEAPPGTRVACPNCQKQVAVPPGAFERGCVIDDFVIDSVIGYGGMATVFLAKQLSMDRAVALKVLAEEYSQRETFRTSFLKEAKAAARLNHPNLIQAMKVGEEAGRLFYAMEYVQGQTLAQRIETERNLEIDAALNIGQQCAEALHAAWTQEGLIHRDIKPDNVMLTPDGYAKIMDLGIAVRAEETETAEISGTPAYMAPEQFRHERLDCRTDIYALGATLFHALVGFPPFDGETVQDVARAHVFQQLQFPENNLVYLPQRIKRMLTRMLAKEPADRYQDYDALLGDLVAIRRRLAPDEDQVPSVHTISFSKYRLFEKMADSPSEIYRKRSEKKKKVAIAREGRVAKPERPRLAPWILLGALLGAIIALGLIVLSIERANNTPFVRQAEKALFEAADASALTQVPAILSQLDQVHQVLATLPAKPNGPERRAAERLRTYREQLQEQRFKLLDSEFTQRQVLHNREAEVLRTDQQKLAADRQALEQQGSDLQKLTSAVKQAQEILAAQQTELKALQDRLAEDTAALRAQEKTSADKRARLLRDLQFGLEWRLIDECRAGRFPEARALAADSVQADPELRDWATRKDKLLTSAERVYRAVFGSAAALRGETVTLKGENAGPGRIIHIERSDVRLVVEKDGIVSYVNVDLGTLDPPDLAALAAKTWSADAPVAAAQFDYALCTGEFGLALKLRPETAPENELRDFLRACLEQLKRDLVVWAHTGRKPAAARRYAWAKALYGDLKEFRALDDELSDLFGAARPLPPPK